MAYTRGQIFFILSICKLLEYTNYIPKYWYFWNFRKTFRILKLMLFKNYVIIYYFIITGLD